MSASEAGGPEPGRSERGQDAVPVSNTSPLLNLAVIGRLSLLQDRFGTVLMPPAVREELRVEEGRPGSEALRGALRSGWLRVRAVEKQDLLAVLQNDLDRGEAEAIALAVELGGRRVLLDEREGRKRARALGLTVTGVLGILLWASGEGKLESARDAIERLKAEAGFYIAPSLEKEILRQIR